MSPRAIASSLFLVLLALSAACGGGDGGPSATATADRASEEEALAAWVRENRNVNFIQNCRDAEPGVDVGKWCGALIGERGTLRAYALGPTFSEPTSFAMLQESAEGWEVLSVTNRDPSAGDVPGIPWPLQEGDAVIVIGLGENDCLSIRERASQSSERLQCVSDGTRAIVQESTSVEAEGFTWWRIAGQAVTGEGFNGWAAGTWLRLEGEIARIFSTPEPEDD
jgi:hypothetical protein